MEKQEEIDPAPYRFVLTPESLCGCGNGRSFGECHGKDGSITIVCRDMNPPEPPTGESIKKCYLGFTNNCGEGISRDHILSKSVLKHIDQKKILFESGGVKRILAIRSDALTTKCLCKRHNSAFHLIDYQAGRLIEWIQMAHGYMRAPSGPSQKAFFFHGWDIERWFLKSLMAIYRARLTVPQNAELPTNIFAGFNAFLPRPYGLYFPAESEKGLSYARRPHLSIYCGKTIESSASRLPLQASR